MEISDRKKKILAAVIDDYIETAEPVGSKTIAQKSTLGLSPATIRNEMSELEAMGFLEQPHTSAGRVPSPLGYRLYVNELMRRHKLSIQETETINRELTQKMLELDRLISDVGRLASRLTSYPAYSLTAPAKVTVTRFDLIYVDANTFIIVAMLSNNSVKNKLVRLPVTIEQETILKLSTMFNVNFTGLAENQITSAAIAAAERAAGDTLGLVSAIAGYVIEMLTEAGLGEAYVSGTSQLLRQPEFRDADKAHRLLSYLSDGDKLLKLPAPDEDGVVKVLIGPENVAEELRDSSVVMASYNLGDNIQGLIGIVGPTRMDYAKIEARLRYLTSGLGKMLSGEPPPHEGKSTDNPLSRPWAENDSGDMPQGADIDNETG